MLRGSSVIIWPAHLCLEAPEDAEARGREKVHAGGGDLVDEAVRARPDLGALR
jgi:predicted ABC-type ATPase